MCDVLIMSGETHDGRTDKEIQGKGFLNGFQLSLSDPHKRYLMMIKINSQ